ncbi:MAG: 2-oxoacid:acceptor oxidoreductase subunit alpha [candidate division WOR-3 bacterium]|nr:MAG: 2-oxoacid:acceptor oxidoreductase subunit alpha [candidate division WOR-3 bacterium]
MSSSRGPDLGIIIAGQAGQGVQLSSEMLGRLFFRAGYEVFVSADVMSRIRGGHNFGRIRASMRPVAANPGKASLLVALDPETVPLHRDELSEGAIVLAQEGGKLESDGSFELVQGPFRDIADKLGGRKVMANMVALGAVTGLMGCDSSGLVGLLESRLRPVDAGLADRNIACVRAGNDFIRSRARFGTLGRIDMSGRSEGRYFMSGAQALALGAVRAGVRLVAGYPMSPGTSVIEACAQLAEETGVLVEQAEDEVSAINMAIGASFAGVLSAVATSGGGFSLMNEALSLAGITETGVVVFSGMRPGPATGLATRTSQADLLSAIYAGHGEFPRAVMCPGNGKQAFEDAHRAVLLAAKYHTPVLVLFDQYLGDAHWTVAGIGTEPARPVRQDEIAGWPGIEPYSYQRYALTETGVSARVLPGTRNQLVYADSDEHTETGHITESADTRVRMVDKRARKLQGLAAEVPPPPAPYPKPEADVAAVCFGSTAGAVEEAVEGLRAKGHAASAVLLDVLWPFPGSALMDALAKCRSIVTVEGNSTGQLGQLLAQECGIRTAGTISRYDGRPISVADVEQGLLEYLRDKDDQAAGV